MGNSDVKLAARLQIIDDEIKSHTSQKNSATIVFLVGLLLSPIGIGIILIIWSAINYFRHKGIISELQQQRIALLS